MGLISDMPADLPGMIEYRLGTHNGVPVVLYSFPRRPVNFISSSGVTDANIIHPRIPYGCTGWRLPKEKEWRSLDELPAHWMPYLNRQRPSEMDPRSKTE